MKSFPHTVPQRLLQLGYVLLGFLAALGAISLWQGHPVQAGPSASSSTYLLSRVLTLEAAASQQRVSLLALQVKTMRLQAQLAKAQAAPAAPTDGTFGPFVVNGTDVTLSGYNLHIVNGQGSTGVVNGLGNLIVGYNEGRGANGTDTRTGSHNIVVGVQNNYSSFGGLVAGGANSISGAYASVTGGRLNTASSAFGSVSGGQGNTASGGRASSVSGGQSNTASGQFAWVSGGVSNVASGQSASVSGGNTNTASGAASSVSGGDSNRASGTAATVSGGHSLTASAAFSFAPANPFTVSGTQGSAGALVSLSGYNLQLVNGLGATNGDPGNTGTRQVNGLGNLIIGYNATRGVDNNGNSLDTRTGSHNLILGDQENYSSYGGLAAGLTNTISGQYASVSGGSSNTASGRLASVSGGAQNTASALYASVSGGFGNAASGNSASVSGGLSNTASNIYASVSGGQNNTASGIVASISGGNTITNSSGAGWAAGGSGTGDYHSP